MSQTYRMRFEAGDAPAITLTYATRAEARSAFFRAAHAAACAPAPALALRLLALQPTSSDEQLVAWVAKAADAECDAGHHPLGVTPLGPPQGGVWAWGTGATRVALQNHELRLTVELGNAPAHYDPSRSLVSRLAAARGEKGVPSEGTYRAAAALADASRVAYRRAEEARAAAEARQASAAEAEARLAARHGLTVAAYRARVTREREMAAAKARRRNLRDRR